MLNESWAYTISDGKCKVTINYVMQSKGYSDFHTVLTMPIHVAYNTTDMTGA